jgi:hypothetical protein
MSNNGLRFRKKPVVIDAIRWTGDNYVALNKFVEEGQPVALPLRKLRQGDDRSILISTLEGEHRANVGDWIIKGIAGEFYPCKPDIFAATYEEVS